jgi:hypothetical protein
MKKEKGNDFQLLEKNLCVFVLRMIVVSNVSYVGFARYQVILCNVIFKNQAVCKEKL